VHISKLSPIDRLSTETQQFFGSDATAAGIRFQFASRIKDHVKLLKQARSESRDCKDVALSGGVNDNGLIKVLLFSFQSRFTLSEAHINSLLAIARTMGSDVTAKAVSHQIPRLKSIGKLQLQALEDGADPKDVVISTTVKDTQG
jgi:hypothetical protein